MRSARKEQALLALTVPTLAIAHRAGQDRGRRILLIVDFLIEKRLEKRPFQCLLFNQALANHNQARLILLQYIVCLVERLLNDAMDLLIDLARRLLAVVALLAKV